MNTTWFIITILFSIVTLFCENIGRLQNKLKSVDFSHSLL